MDLIQGGTTVPHGTLLFIDSLMGVDRDVVSELNKKYREVQLNLTLEIQYRVPQVDVENLQLTMFRQFWQLLGCYCSYLLPRQDCGTSLIQVNRRLSTTTWATLYLIT